MNFRIRISQTISLSHKYNTVLCNSIHTGVFISNNLGIRDIDEIITLVKHSIPDIVIYQLQKKRQGDDDGIWWFVLQNNTREIQIENPYGMCPFLVETNEESANLARSAYTVEQTAAIIIDYLY